MRTPRHRRSAVLAPLVEFRLGGLGPLEIRLLDYLWLRGAPLAVREVRDGVPQLAYTTVMTTLDRLYRKGVLLRRRRGRAFVYEPRHSRSQMLHESVAARVLGLWRDSEARSAILSTLVHAAGRRDQATLDELEALIRAERARLKREEPR